MVAVVFADCETVRIGTEHGSAVWELALICRDTDGDTEYLWQLRPNLEHADAKSLQIGGYYERCKVADKPAGSGIVLSHPKMPGKTGARGAHLIALDVARLLDGALIVGANPWFDAGHIDAFLREYGQALAADYHMRDISSLVAGFMAGRGHLPPASSKLTDSAWAMEIDPGKYETHTAPGDAKLARDIWDAVFA